MVEKAREVHFPNAPTTQQQAGNQRRAMEAIADAFGVPALVEALSFYADPANWIGSHLHDPLSSESANDGGERARAALGGERVEPSDRIAWAVVDGVLHDHEQQRGPGNWPDGARDEWNEMRDVLLRSIRDDLNAERSSGQGRAELEAAREKRIEHLRGSLDNLLIYARGNQHVLDLIHKALETDRRLALAGEPSSPTPTTPKERDDAAS